MIIRCELQSFGGELHFVVALIHVGMYAINMMFFGPVLLQQSFVNLSITMTSNLMIFEPSGRRCKKIA